jgi:hypothetical protein
MFNSVCLFLLLVAGQLILDTSQFPKCFCGLGKLLIVLHHALAIYIFFGSLLFGHHKFHLIFIAVALCLNVLFHVCPISIWHNYLCDFPRKTPLPTYLNHVGSIFQLQKHTLRKLYISFICMVMFYDLQCVLKH